jgi:2-keto-4-pentenoate hydratase/2-oxohepta-3-ene-1,7-dioic acid hydratase in catechol pathway
MASTGFTTTHTSLTNYVAYHDPLTGRNHVGHYDLIKETLETLAFLSGTFIDNLYQVIEVGESNIISLGDPIPIASVKVLPPLAGRDVLCVGKNYAEHAKEFNSSGFDSSDKVDQPSHPVIFTKRFTSIIADGEEIYPHPEFTQTLDYEGEIGVIIGKPGFRILEEEAMNHVWGYTIINDVTARERQRDHKQFYIGKSADTFCPMVRFSYAHNLYRANTASKGPMAVPASKLEQVLRVQTRVNGDLRQNATTDDLIFSIPRLIRTMSEGQTLLPGDVLATGTVGCFDTLAVVNQGSNNVLACGCRIRVEAPNIPEARRYCSDLRHWARDFDEPCHNLELEQIRCCSDRAHVFSATW